MNDEQLQTMLESVDPARDLSDEALNELLPHDQLLAKITAGSAPAAPATARSRPARMWHRVLAFLGSAVAAGSVVVAVVVMLFGSSPAAVQGIGVGTKTTVPPPVLKIEPQNLGFGGTAFTPNFAFTVDPSLSTADGSATAYELSSPTDLASVTGEIGTALGVTGPVTYLGPGNYQVGPSSGPDVVVGTDGGILTWQYPDWTDQPPGVSVPVNDALPVPTDAQASADARQLLLSMGVKADQLGTPQIERASAAVTVYFPMVVDGVVTDQTSSINYGHGGTVLATMGIITNAAPSTSYPTISPTQAVSLLSPSGDSTYGGSYVSAGSSASDVVTVDVNEATLGLSTYMLADGTNWLLPTWSLSGPETGSQVTAGANYEGNVLAVSPEFVQLQPR
jgi:hypothetical protein